jgi:dTDP-4-dehydrorhamnose reductase
MLGGAVVRTFAPVHDVIPHARADSDLADQAATERWFAARRPEIVVHCAAWTDVDGCESDPERARRDNADATRNVALAARAAGAALCLLSTDYVFDGEKPSPYVEADAPNPLGVYGRTKLAAERHVRELVPSAWIVRTSWVFGRGGRNFVGTIASLLRSKGEIRVVDDQTGCPTFTNDLAAALRTIVERGEPGTYHVTNAGACTWYRFAVAIEAQLATGCRILPCTTAEFPRPARRPRNSVLEPANARRQGLPLPRPWQDALVAYLPEMQREAGAA